MAYVRIKKISGNPYAYLVENEKTDKGPRQRVKKYLGRVYPFKEEISQNKEVKESNKNKFVKALILRELAPRKFKQKDEKYYFDKLVFSPKTFSVSKGKKNVVLAFNGGYLSQFTIERIINFKKTNNLKKDATILAKYFLDAGLLLSREEFVNFYQIV